MKESCVYKKKSNQMSCKKIYILFACCIAFFSCTTEKAQETAIVTGKVNVRWSKNIKLTNGVVTLVDPWINRTNIGDTIIPLNEDGTFRIELSLDKPDFRSIAHETNEVQFFIAPNDSLHIDFTAENRFSGTVGTLNDHLAAMRNMINNNRRYINGLAFYNQSSEAVNAILDSLENSYINAHKNFTETHQVPEEFDKRILADLMYRSKLYQTVHPALYTQKTTKHLPVQKTYYDAIAKGSFDNPALLKSLDYILFLDAYLTAQAAGNRKFGNYFDDPIERIHPKYTQIQQLDAHQEIKDYLFSQHIHKSMDSYGVVYLQDIMPMFRKDCKNPVLVKQMEDRFQNGMKRREAPTEIKIYKKIGNIELEAHIFYPKDFKAGDQRPAYLFFHGGGWSIGVPEWGYNSCEKYSAKGMVAISFEYRIIDIHQSNLLDCVRDAKSAILWTRKQAKSLGIDPNKIVAAGFSAGGHLAACTAILDEFEETDTSGLSSKPNAIVVHSASYNTLKNNWFSRKSEQRAKSISTFHQLDKGLVPSIFFHGTDDHLAPISEFTEFRDKMVKLGNDFEYKIFQNVGHFFQNAAARKEVGELTDAFFVKLGYIEK